MLDDFCYLGAGNSKATLPAGRTTLRALMTDISRELLDSVHSAGACLVDIRELAGKVVHLSAGQVAALLQRFVDDGEDQAVSRLLHACAFNGMKLDPEILCRCIGVCEDMLDSAPCFALQDESAVLCGVFCHELDGELRGMGGSSQGRVETLFHRI